MNEHTNVVVNYREFTNFTEEQMLLARANAKAIERNPDDYMNPTSHIAAYYARAEALLTSWQFVTAGYYDEIDRARLVDLL